MVSTSSSFQHQNVTQQTSPSSTSTAVSSSAMARHRQQLQKKKSRTQVTRSGSPGSTSGKHISFVPNEVMDEYPSPKRDRSQSLCVPSAAIGMSPLLPPRIRLEIQHNEFMSTFNNQKRRSSAAATTYVVINTAFFSKQKSNTSNLLIAPWTIHKSYIPIILIIFLPEPRREIVMGLEGVLWV